MLSEIQKEKLLDFLLLQIRNLWRVDGLYFLGIEKRYGSDIASQIDSEVWEAMAAIEAKSLRKLFQVDENATLPTIIKMLRRSSWALDQPLKTVRVESEHATLRIDNCRTQETRLSKGLSEFSCKNVRLPYLKVFAKTLNPNAVVDCVYCPPDTHPKDAWCEWAFSLKTSAGSD